MADDNSNPKLEPAVSNSHPESSDGNENEAELEMKLAHCSLDPENGNSDENEAEPEREASGGVSPDSEDNESDTFEGSPPTYSPDSASEDDDGGQNQAGQHEDFLRHILNFENDNDDKNEAKPEMEASGSVSPDPDSEDNEPGPDTFEYSSSCSPDSASKGDDGDENEADQLELRSHSLDFENGIEVEPRMEASGGVSPGFEDNESDTFEYLRSYSPDSASKGDDGDENEADQYEELPSHSDSENQEGAASQAAAYEYEAPTCSHYCTDSKAGTKEVAAVEPKEPEEIRYKPGDIILNNCKPFLKILNPERKGRRCDYCFVLPPKELRFCSGCKLMWYCSKKCQNKDWKHAHKIECNSEVFRSNQVLKEKAEFKFMLFRLWATLKTDPSLRTKEFVLHDGSIRTFNDLPNHSVKHYTRQQIKAICQEFVTAMEREDPTLTLRRVVEFFGILQTNNTFPILNEDESAHIGFGLYIEPSLFKHSCTPTAYHWYNGTRMQVRAIALIPQGEVPTISFLAAHSHLAREIRQSTLRSRFNYDCKCTKCVTESDRTINYDNLGGMIIALQDDTSTAKLGWETVLKRHEALMRQLESLYHKYDWRITDHYKLMANYAVKLFSCQMTREKRNEFIDEAKDRLSITYGPDHHDYKKFFDFHQAQNSIV